MDHVRTAAHGAVLHVLLVLARRQVQRDDDFFAAGVASIGAFVVHVGDSTLPQTDVEWLSVLMGKDGDLSEHSEMLFTEVQPTLENY